jgi:anion-transporting  ArsA/GET3 family ATPase
MGLNKLLEEKKVVICCGSGGVGKTSIAAALAIKGAMMGKKTMALTIDPAKRLADSLGLEPKGNEETPILLESLGLIPPGSPGSLHAMALDRRGNWDELIGKYAPNEEIGKNILNNPFYKNLSHTFAGSQEYLAMEKLYDLYVNRKYDLIVVDTPPTKHTLDFLEVPQKMSDFLDRKIIKWFMLPYFSAGRMGLKLLGKTGLFVFRRLEEATGIYVLKDVSEFFLNLSSMIDGTIERMRKASEILRNEQTAFSLIITPDPSVLSEAAYFLKRIDEFKVPLGAVIINKVNAAPEGIVNDGQLEEIKNLAKDQGGVENRLGERLVENYLQFRLLAQADINRIQSFKRTLPSNQIMIYPVPYLEKDLYAIKGLLRLNQYLFPDGS